MNGKIERMGKFEAERSSRDKHRIAAFVEGWARFLEMLLSDPLMQKELKKFGVRVKRVKNGH